MLILQRKKVVDKIKHLRKEDRYAETFQKTSRNTQALQPLKTVRVK